MEAKSKIQQDKDLTEALQDTMPASDPVSANVADDHAVRPADRKPALIDKALVDRLARAVGEKRT